MQITTNRAAGVLLALAASACGDPHGEDHGQLGVNASFSECPLITQVSAYPLEVLVHGEIELNAEFNEQRPRLSWHTTAGSFEDAGAARTSYFCDVQGDQQLTLVMHGDDCIDRVEVNVRCSAALDAGR